MKIAATFISIFGALSSVIPLGAVAKPDQASAQVNGITIAYESFGKPDRTTILLIGGSGMQLTDWPREFCEQLVQRGYRVVIYDNRDIGLSTHFTASGTPDFGAVVQAAADGKPSPLPYTLYDMADDAVALLDALGIKKAHIVGVSMGGIIAQIVATVHPEHTLSLTSIMATDGKPGLPIFANPERLAKISPPVPDEDKSAYIARMVKTWQIIGSQTYPQDEHFVLDRVTQDVERSYCPSCDARQGAASLFTTLEDRRLKIRAIRVPAVVIQGDEDPLIPIEAARDVAANIPGADLRIIHGMGHDVPPPLVNTIVNAVVSAASRADRHPTEKTPTSSSPYPNGPPEMIPPPIPLPPH
jgi:pimeloyl-ACP methyl ester carboxylesterase